MKISYNWLKEILSIDYAPAEVSAMLTNCGLEVENYQEVETIKGGLKGVVVGKVLTVNKHPDADKLKITTVDIGNETILNIVCGAPNISPNQKVLVATVGTKLYAIDGNTLEIKKSKIRGAISEGMICAEDEIGIGKSHDGVLVLNDAEAIQGMTAAEYLNIENDYVFEIGLTPNRIDAASHIGVARDLAAVINAKNETNISTLKIPIAELSNFEQTGSSLIYAEVVNQESCSRYSGISINNITITESPEWLKKRLISVGLRPINNVVDITNYVMYECGQPLHAFDISQIEDNKINVRFAKNDEKIITLDDSCVDLSTNDIVIANANEPMCIAGVFGGKNFGVTSNTKSVFIESACFNSVSVRKTSKRLNLKTDASYRFERGTDPNNTVYALKRATQLICELAGGKISSEIIDIYPTPIEKKIIAFSFNNCDKLIGKRIEHKLVINILNSLEIEILEKGTDALKIAIPTAKVDVTREVDVIEEVLRIYGYNNIELPNKLNSSISYASFPDNEKWSNSIADLLSANGFIEMMSLSLTNSQNISPRIKPVQILNPLSSELNILRQSLLYSGLEAITYNQNRKKTNLKLYEFGKIYSYDESQIELKKYQEKTMLSLFISGSKMDESWTEKNNKANFFTLKSIIEKILKKTGIKFTTIDYSDEFGAGLNYQVNEKSLIKIQKINKKLINLFEIKESVFYAEIDWALLVKIGSKTKIEFTELAKYPAVRRDLAMIVHKKTKYSDLEKMAFKIERKILKSVNLFDVYEGENIPEGKKSYAISFILQDSNSTLNEKQIENTMTQIQKSFENEFGAVLR